MNFDELSHFIKSHLPDAEISITDLTGTKDHLGLQIISDVFEGKALLEQHRIIMDILKEKLKNEIHAVQLKTMTKAKARERGLLS
jgi:stress-induced morphogen